MTKGVQVPKKRQEQEPVEQQEPFEVEPFEQAYDPHGRMRTDRPLTLAEASAQDAANRERYLQERAARFAPRTGTGPS